MESRSVRIYALADSPRLRYIAGILLGDLLGLPWELVNDRRKLGKHPVINYTGENITGSFRIDPVPLLFENGIGIPAVTVSQWKNLPVFFGTDGGSDLPFDIFAAAFYLITRYEEYNIPFKISEPTLLPSSSLAGRNGFLHKPVIELWTKELARALLRKFPSLTFRRNEHRTLVTFDLVRPFAYLGHSLIGSFGEMIRDLASSDGRAGDRFRSVVKGEKDPFEVFDYLNACISKHRSFSAFFLPVGNHSNHEKSPSWKNEEYRSLVRKISAVFNTGLYSAGENAGDKEKIATEKGRLEALTGHGVVANRFHMARFPVPQAYKTLLSAGLTEDYSMGYHQSPGFRAGIARPFFFFDLAENRQTGLRIIPFQLSDNILEHNEGNTREFREMVTTLFNETKAVGGTFITIWHNTSLTADSGCAQCREIFELLLGIQAQ